MNAIIKFLKEYRLILSLSIAATIVAVVVSSGYNWEAAVIGVGIILLANVITIIPRGLAVTLIVVSQGLLTSLAIQEVFIPITYYADENESLANYIYVALAHQFFVAVMLPLLALTYFYKAHGRVWINTLITALVYSLFLVLAILSTDFLLSSVATGAAIVLPVIFVFVKTLVSKKMHPISSDILTADNKVLKDVFKDEVIVEATINKVVAGKRSIPIIALPIKDKIIVSNKGFMINNKDVNQLVESTLLKIKENVLLIIDSNKQDDKVSVNKFSSPTKPDYKYDVIIASPESASLLVKQWQR